MPLNPGGCRSSPALLQLRQRSLQQLSPTSTPLSSLGRQSSRGSACSEDSLTPRSSLRAARSSQLQRSVSPLGAGPAAVEAEAHPAMAANSSAAALLGGQRARPLEADASSHPQQAEELPDKGNRYPAVGQAERLPDQAPEEPALPAREFGASALHSRASSCDLTYYAPFSMDREGPGAFAASDAQVGCECHSSVERLHHEGMARNEWLPCLRAVPLRLPMCPQPAFVLHAMRYKSCHPHLSSLMVQPPSLHPSGITEAVCQLLLRPGACFCVGPAGCAAGAAAVWAGRPLDAPHQRR